jgi:hypothetical protein
MADVSLSLSNRVELFKRRMRLDAKQQPGWHHVLAALECWKADRPPHHPYPPAKNDDCPVPEYFEVCKGSPVKLDRCDFLYRIANVGAVITSTNSVDPFRTNVPEKNWNLVKADQSTPKSWLKLSKYIIGPLPGRRQFTWWTPFDLGTPPVLPNVHQIGLVNDWLGPFVFLLRMSTRGVDLGSVGRVPTVIDGFDSPIFYATDEQNSAIGAAIDLRKPDLLRAGAPELVASYVASEDVDVLPIELTSEERSLFRIDEEAVIGPLIGYYAALGA